MRYKIRLLASLHIQRLSIRPFQPAGPPRHASFRLTAEPVEQAKLQPFQTQQYILTVRNPLFDSVKVTLSTPGTTPGKVASRVTILCPSFTVGPAGENMWDEALSASVIGTGSDGSRRAAMASLTGGSADSDRQPEAGKVWERSRNSTSVILEIVPGSLKPPPSFTPKSEQQPADDILGEDDDVLEIPIHVRAEWDADPANDQGHLAAGEKKERESKELAYWCVLGVGQIANV
jgi:dynactin-4